MRECIIDNFIPPFNSGGKSYAIALEELLNDYKEFIKRTVNPGTYIIRKIEKINSLILSTISNIKAANSQKAYEGICKFINDEKENISFPIYILNNKKPLIRLRYSESDLLYRKDIFHIPFAKRHDISQQRYSITGVPCLYLSGCAFTAWLELNKPNFSNLWCAGFRAKNNIKVLNLAVRLDSIIKETDLSGELIFYPFVIATSFAAKYPKSPFKEEYIISNILLQAIINNTDLSGIRYFSTKISNYKNEHAWMATNIVLPAKSESGDYDKILMSSLLLTYPQPCSVLMHSPNIGDVSCMGTGMTELDNRDEIHTGINHFEPRIFEWYSATQFFNIDGYLRNDLAYNTIED